VLLRVLHAEPVGVKRDGAALTKAASPADLGTTDGWAFADGFVYVAFAHTGGDSAVVLGADADAGASASSGAESAGSGAGPGGGADDSGCGCHTGRGVDGTLSVGAFVLAWLVGRRRRRAAIGA